MKRWDAQQIAHAAGARLLHGKPGVAGPQRVSIDSRDLDAEVLFVGLPGASVDGGSFAQQALDAGAWGVLVAPEHGETLRAGEGQAVIAAAAPLQALQQLARAWRRALGAAVIGVTGSTGKTSTKDMLLALLAPQRRAVASRANFNTEIGLPIEILGAPDGTELLVLEMGMRGRGQIAELARIAEPDVGVIVSVGPVHLELLGSIEAIAAAKAELIAALPAGGTAIVPAGEPLLAPHLREDLQTVTFGPGGTVQLRSEDATSLEIDAGGERLSLGVDFSQRHLRRNLLAAVAAARAVGVTPAGRVEVRFSPGRGDRLELPGDITLFDDCYNANPMSMRASLDELALTAGGKHRRVAVLGDMLELGPDARRYHAEIGAHADSRADVLVTVGTLAAAMAEPFHGEYHHADDAADAAALVPRLIHDGDFVLVKASNGVGLRRVCEALSAGARA